MKTRVAAVKAPDYRDAEDSVFRAVDLLGGVSFLKPGWKVLIKPNLLVGYPPDRAVNTHPAVVEAVVKLVKEAGCEPLMGDSPVVGRGDFHYRAPGYAALCRKYGVPWVNFEDDAVEVEGRHTFKRIFIARAAYEADAIINLPKVKTHGQTYLTLSVKNMFGIVPGIRKAQWHFTAGRDLLRFGGMLTEVCYLKKPALSIVDGISAMHGNGPRNGQPYPLGYIFAGEDPTAVDTVICRTLKVSPDKVPTLNTAAKLNLGISSFDDIEIAGDLPFETDVADFRFPGRQSPADLGIWGKLPLVKSGTTSKPVIDNDKCTRCEECVEHCPAEAMSLVSDDGDKEGRVSIDLDLCIRCYCCNEVCPEGAVSVKEGWLWRLLPGLFK